MKRDEDIIQRAVVNLLRASGVANMTWFHVPNGGRRSRIEASIMKGLGVRAGVPDIIIIHSGKCYALELKASKGRVSPTQRAMMAEFNDAGITTAVATGMDEAIDQLRDWGVIRTAVFS